jgi:hypothetical protein
VSAHALTSRPMVSEQDREDVLHARGIDDRIIDGGGHPPRYASYERGEWERVFLHAGIVPDGNPSSATWKGWIGQQPGILIIRRSMRDWALATIRWRDWVQMPRPAAQIRPSAPIFTGSKGARYILLADSRTARTIDIHPLARNAVRKARQPLFLVLEGSLKADACLSAGLAAISVPGVTLWDTHDLNAYLPTIRKAPSTFVVTDSDWNSNRSVHAQATRCVASLQAAGLPAIHVAPPELDGKSKTGVDDYLAAGHTPEGLLLVPSLPDEAPAWLPAGQKAAMDWLLGFRTPRVCVSPSQMARHLAITRQAARTRMMALETNRQIEIFRGPTYLGANGWTTDPHEVRLITPQPLKDLGWRNDLLMIPQAHQRVTKAIREEWARLVRLNVLSNVPPCAFCGRELEHKGDTRPRIYCSGSCRSAAHRARRAQS